MEEEKSQPPDHQLQPSEGLKAIFDVYMDEDEEWEADRQVIDAALAAPVFDAGDVDFHMEEEEKDVEAEEGPADRQNRAAAIAADEEMAHRLYMEDLMQMEEWQLRDINRPSLRAALAVPLSDFPTSSSSSRAGVGANTAAQGRFWTGTPPYARNPTDPVVQPYVPPHARARGTFESVQEAESGAVFLGNSRIPEPLELQAEKGKGPLDEVQVEERVREMLAAEPRASNGGLGLSLATPGAEREAVFLPRATMASNRRILTARGFMRTGPRDWATTPARQQTVLSEDAAGSSSIQHVPGDGKAFTEPSETTAPASVVPSAGCGATAPPARTTVPASCNDPVSSKRRDLRAEDHSSIMFAELEEGNNNSWYESMLVPDDDEEPEQVELQDLNESLQQCIPRYEPNNPAARIAEGREFSLQDFCQSWEVTPADIEPDEPGPSTRAPKVRPLADHEVPTFDCGICMETLPVFDLFHGLPCKHRFCASCMTTYVEGRIRATELPIPCPETTCGRGEEGGGSGVLHPEKCKKAIDYGAFGDWGARLTESALPPDRRAYCPNQRCGVLLETSGAAEPARAPCPACGHALCATCGMEWSSDSDGQGVHDCAKSPEAALVRKLAQDHRWKRCPSCKMFVERIDGCNRMTCRCRFVFCYKCGNPMFRGQAGGEGMLPCRCHDTGMAFAMAHLHQAHAQPNIVDQAMQLPPVEVDLNMALPQAPPLELEVDLNTQPRWDADPAGEEEEVHQNMQPWDTDHPEEWLVRRFDP